MFVIFRRLLMTAFKLKGVQAVDEKVAFTGQIGAEGQGVSAGNKVIATAFCSTRYYSL